MLFRVSLHLLAIQRIIAWLVLLFQLVIFFAENSDHHKQNKDWRSYGRLSFWKPASFVKGNYKPLARSGPSCNMQLPSC